AIEIYNIQNNQINPLEKMIFKIFIFPFNYEIYYNGQIVSLTLIFVLFSFYFFKKRIFTSQIVFMKHTEDVSPH
ncbi:unnamed protein product, partial [marine sediment metagenome]